MTCIAFIQEVALNYPFRQIIFIQVKRVKAYDRVNYTGLN